MTLKPGLILPLLGVSTDPTMAQQEPTPSTFGWVTVTSTAPTLVRRDGEDMPLPMTPELVAPIAFTTGDRLWCQFYGLRVLILGRSPDGWHPFPYAAGWANYGTGFDLGAYTMSGTEVHLEGLCKGGSGLIGTLPLGYRARGVPMFTVSAAGGGTAEVRVSSTGAVTLTSVTTTTGYLSLAQIRFTPAP